MCEYTRSNQSLFFTFRYNEEESAVVNARCMAASGLPFIRRGLIYRTVSLGDSSVVIGDREYEGSVAEATFSEHTCGPAPYCTGDTTDADVVSTLLEGVGQVSLVATYRENRAYDPVRRDTIRATLLGAVVGGVSYGDLRPVAVDDDLSPPGLDVRVGPNPSRGAVTAWVTLGDARDAEVSVLDALGRVVRSVPIVGGGAVALDLSGQPAGVYVVRLEVGARSASSRVVVVR
ncbi:T9SS type A sorting domain-containing protein [Rubrivirga sp.]|uniref:T9SS type A sorting domain-containing protein n=1 Tax=Rubrivirga sp. TaxID=1885344 RepID=UPI003C766DE0